jgi:hypothetical protein
MTVVLAITVVVVLAVVAAGTVVTDHGLWKVWQSIPREWRRRGAGGEGVKAFRAQWRRSKAGGEANGSTPGHA